MKIDNWNETLTRFIEAHALTPFRWGVWDCVLMCGLCADRLTGNTYADEYICAYDSEETAHTYLQDHYGTTFSRIFDRYYKRIRSQHAQRGDIVLCVKPTGQEVYAIKLSNSLAMAGPHGVVIMPASEVKIITAWRVE